MNQLRVVTKPYTKKTRLVMATLQEFNLKKPNRVVVVLSLNNKDEEAILKINDKIYISGAYGTIKNLTNQGFTYRNVTQLTDTICYALLEAGFPVELKRVIKN